MCLLKSLDIGLKHFSECPYEIHVQWQHRVLIQSVLIVDVYMCCPFMPVAPKQAFFIWGCLESKQVIVDQSSQN